MSKLSVECLNKTRRLQDPTTTPWFDGSVKPARDGVYQRAYGQNGYYPELQYCRFERGRWYVGCHLPQTAERVKSLSMYQDLPWRGLAQRSGRNRK